MPVYESETSLQNQKRVRDQLVNGMFYGSHVADMPRFHPLDYYFHNSWIPTAFVEVKVSPNVFKQYDHYAIDIMKIKGAREFEGLTGVPCHLFIDYSDQMVGALFRALTWDKLKLHKREGRDEAQLLAFLPLEQFKNHYPKKDAE